MRVKTKLFKFAFVTKHIDLYVRTLNLASACRYNGATHPATKSWIARGEEGVCLDHICQVKLDKKLLDSANAMPHKIVCNFSLRNIYVTLSLI